MLAVILVLLSGAAVGVASAQDAVVSPGDSIQSAVDAAGPDDVIAVESGDYKQSVTISRTRNLTLRAADSATPVINGSSQSQGTTLIELAPQNDTAIQGLRIEGFRFEDAPSHSGGSFTSGHAVAMFEDNVVNDVAVVDNTFDNTGIAPPSSYEGAGIVLDNVDGLLIQGNVLRGVARDGSPIGFGTTLDQKAAISIHDYDDDNDISDVVVRGNTIVNVTRGMWIGGISPASNTLLDNVTIVDNRIEDVLREGIRAEVAAAAGDGRLLVENNELVGADAAVRVNSGEVVVRDLVVRGRAPNYGLAAGDHYGLGLEDGGDVTAEAVDIADQEDDGVKVLNGNLTLRDSTVRSNDADDIDVRDPTLRLDTVDVGSGTISGEATEVTIEEAAPRPDLPNDTTSVGAFNATNRTPSGYVDAAVEYTTADALTVEESTLAMHRYDDTNASWPAVTGTAVDMGANRVAANLTSFSAFAAFGNATAPPSTGGGTANTDPVALADRAPSTVSVGEPVTFDASDSYDEDGRIVDYDWTIDGASYTGENVTLTFDRARENYVFELSVEDDDGSFDETSGIFDVESATETGDEQRDENVTVGSPRQREQQDQEDQEAREDQGTEDGQGSTDEGVSGPGDAGGRDGPDDGDGVEDDGDRSAMEQDEGTGNRTATIESPEDRGVTIWYLPVLLILLLVAILAARKLTEEDDEDGSG